MRRLLPMLTTLGLTLLALPASGAPEQPPTCRTVDPGDAMASGHAAVVQVLRGPGAPYSISEVEARQDGPGMAHDGDEAGHANVGGIVRLRLAPAHTDVRVDAEPLGAGSWTTAEALDVDVLDGLVTADAVKAATFATADVRHARTDSGSSEIVGLRVKGVSVTQVAPGVRVDLSPLFGAGSYVSVYERAEASKFPGADGILYAGDVTVRMIHVVLADHDPLALGPQPLEVVVGMSHSHAQVPTPHCGVLQFVGASAYVARLRPEGGLGEGILAGEQSIGPVDGDARQQLVGQEVLADGEILRVNAAQTIATGRAEAGVSSRAQAVSQVTDACLLVDGMGTGCLVSATLVKAESDSFADAKAAISWGHTTIVGLKVAGVDVCETLGMEETCSPPMGTTLDVAGIKVILNQHEGDSPMPGHSGLTVRAVRVMAPGVGDVVIGRAHSEAAFVDFGT